MAQPMPKHPNLVGGFAPIQMECDAPDLVVEGEVPADLAGTFSGMDLTHSLRREADTTGLLAMACSTHFILRMGALVTRIVGRERRSLNWNAPQDGRYFRPSIRWTPIPASSAWKQMV